VIVAVPGTGVLDVVVVMIALLLEKAAPCRQRSLLGGKLDRSRPHRQSARE
jgi:hypothetical protein